MTSSARKPLAIFGLLMLLMAVTRYYHFGSAVQLPDASLAVFFLAGFYVAHIAALPVLLVAAGLIDYLAISVGSVSDWCVTPAYAFLVPTYAAMWYGGRWYAARHRLAWSTLLPLALALFVATSVAFLISNGSFYMASGRFPEMGGLEYALYVAGFYPAYVASTFAYTGLTALLHAGIGALHNVRSAARAGHKLD
jgi:hypothetical protein